MFGTKFLSSVSRFITTQVRQFGVKRMYEKSLAAGEIDSWFSVNAGKYQVPVVRMRPYLKEGDDSSYSFFGAASATLHGVPMQLATATYQENVFGFGTLQPANKVMLYMYDSNSDLQSEDNQQPYMSVFTALKQYHEFLKNPDKDFTNFLHNELRIDLKDKHLFCMVVDENEIERARQEMKRKGFTQDLFFFDQKSGKWFDTKTRKEVELAPNVLSIEKLENDPLVQKLTEHATKTDLERNAEWIVKHNMDDDGTIPSGYLFGSKVFQPFVKDLEKVVAKKEFEVREASRLKGGPEAYYHCNH